MIAPNVLLSGVVGSTAYGLAVPGSDRDVLGVFAHPTRDLVTLNRPPATFTQTAPDETFHEAEKYCQLALKGNPTVMELLWLPDDLYTLLTPLGRELRDIRTQFLSARRVRDAYLGFADQQVRRMKGRVGPDVLHGTRKRSAKHARHLYRLIIQGTGLYITGQLQVRLDDKQAQAAREFGERVAANGTDEAKATVELAREVFDRATSALPDEPSIKHVEEWLSAVRTAYWSPES